MAKKREAKEKEDLTEKTYKYNLPRIKWLTTRNVISSINKKQQAKAKETILPLQVPLSRK